MDCFASLAMTSNFKCDSAFPRRDAPEVCKNRSPNKQRAQGMPGASCTRSLACEIKQSTRARSPQVQTDFTRHSPRNGFTAYFVLSPVTTLFDTVACASYRRLDANDWGVRTTRLGRPRQHHSSSAPTASTASRPAFVTIAIRPSCRNETGRISEPIWVGRKQKYFCKRGLTPFRKIRSDLPVGHLGREPVPRVVGGRPFLLRITDSSRTSRHVKPGSARPL